MKIDFSDYTKLDKETYLAFMSFCNENKSYFNEIIGKITIPLKENLDWLVSSTASRNITDYSLYRDFCIILFIKKKIKINDIEEIVVDSTTVKKILRSFIQNNKIKIKVRSNKNKISSVKNFFVLPYCFIINIIKYYSCRLSGHKKTKLPNKPLTFIDTNFVQGASQSYNNSFYGSLWDLLDEEKKKTTFFLPTLFITNKWNLYSTFKMLKEKNPSYIFKEDYLKISDIFYALFHYLRKKFIKIDKIYCEGIDVSSLFISDFKSLDLGYYNSVQGILTYRFFLRLKEIEVKIKTIVDWWENQPRDKGLHLGIYKFYKETIVRGYTSGPSNLALQYYPTAYEQDNHVVPNTIFVQGKAFIDGIKKINKKQKVSVAPAFRFYSVYNNFHHKPDPSTYTILILLPVYLKNSFDILNNIKDYLKKYNTPNLRILIKPHPTMNKKAVKTLSENLSNNCEITTDDVMKNLSKANVLIGSMTSTCLEAMALGIPVIVLEQPYGLFGLLTVPKEIPQNYWKYCTSAEEMFKAIAYFRKESKDSEGMKNYIRENYFEKVTKNSVFSFLES